MDAQTLKTYLYSSATAVGLALASVLASEVQAQTGIPTDRALARSEAAHPLCSLSRSTVRKERLMWLDGVARREPAYLLIHAENIYAGWLDLPAASLYAALGEAGRLGVPQAQYNLLFLLYRRWLSGEALGKDEVAKALAKVPIGTFRGALAYKMGYVFAMLREHVLGFSDGLTLEGYRLAAGYGNADAAYRYVVGVLQIHQDQVATDADLRRYLKKLVNTLSGQSAQLMGLRGVLWATGFFEGSAQARAYYAQVYKRASELMVADVKPPPAGTQAVASKIERDAQRLIKVQGLKNVTIAIDYEFVCRQ